MMGPGKGGEPKIIIGIGSKPGAGDDSESDMDPKEAAGLELCEALGLPTKGVDGAAVCEAVANIAKLHGYGEEEESEEADAAE